MRTPVGRYVGVPLIWPQDAREEVGILVAQGENLIAGCVLFGVLGRGVLNTVNISRVQDKVPWLVWQLVEV